MNVNDKPLILLTNDDGIRSPGLWAAADALSELGFVVVAAPREQSSGYGRSLPNSSDGVIREEEVTVRGKTWKVFAVGGSPAQAVQCGVLEIAPRQPDLVVAGINYGENVGLGFGSGGFGDSRSRRLGRSGAASASFVFARSRLQHGRFFHPALCKSRLADGVDARCRRDQGGSAA